MKLITKFLLAVFSFAPVTVGAAPISQTAGSNLTQYNGSMGNIVGNQWNTMTNPRINAQNTTVKVDFGNCNAIIIRCATPKCSGGGCGNMDIAKSIVSGCVNSNEVCKKYGEDLINYISAQLVSDSVALQNQQAAAAAAASEQNAQQIAAMQQQMQQQMMQMQEQSNAKIDALQDALAESQRATNEAVQQAAASAAQSAQTQVAANSVGTELTTAQASAATSGVDPDIIKRATITGEILTSMEGVDTSLDNLKTTMRTAFKYGGCNEINGNNCTGPKRIKKFKDLANKFMEPYDALVENLEDALIRAQTVGVDMGDIYMMLSGSCNRWAEYVCNYTGEKECIEVKKTTIDATTVTSECVKWSETGLPRYDETNCTKDSAGAYKSDKTGITKGGKVCGKGQVIPPEDLVGCTVNRILTDEDSIKEAWLNPDESSTGVIRIGCASDIINSGIFKRRGGNKAGSIDIDVLELLINQDAPNKPGTDDYNNIKNFCAITYNKDAHTTLKSATISRNLGKICCDKPNEKCNGECDGDNLAHVSPIYALCNVHAYNISKQDNSDLDSEDRDHIQEIIGLKTTVIAQQMYKQYSMIESMIKRLKIQLEKSALKASLQVASGTSDNDDSNTKVTFDDCSGKDSEDALRCLRNNYSKLKPFVDKGNIRNDVAKQIITDCKVFKSHLNEDDFKWDNNHECPNESSVKSKRKDALDSYMDNITKLSKQIKKENRDQELLDSIYKRK